MLAERSYPLSEEVCRMMLKKKLFSQNIEVKKKLVKLIEKKAKMMEKQAGAKGLTSPEQTATVEMVFSRPWTCTFLVAKGLATPELMANCACSRSQFTTQRTSHLNAVKRILRNPQPMVIEFHGQRDYKLMAMQETTIVPTSSTTES
ncbi:hypothetical protein Tco_0825350 [Tanacetum coccineum]